MKAVGTVGVGLVLLISGAMLVFGGDQGIPLWISWLVGPMLWYGGFIVTVLGLFLRIKKAIRGHQARKKAHAVVLFSRKRKVLAGRLGLAPAGVQREIPPMGGFIL